MRSSLDHVVHCDLFPAAQPASIVVEGPRSGFPRDERQCTRNILAVMAAEAATPTRPHSRTANRKARRVNGLPSTFDQRAVV